MPKICSAPNDNLPINTSFEPFLLENNQDEEVRSQTSSGSQTINRLKWKVTKAKRIKAKKDKELAEERYVEKVAALFDQLAKLFKCEKKYISKPKLDILLGKNNKDTEKVLKKIKINKKYYKGVLTNENT